MVPELQAWAVGTAVEGAEGEEADLAAATSMEAVVMEDMAATTMATGVGAVDLMANATFATRPATSWESKKQVDQALSSVESEYMALFRAIREVVWQRHSSWLGTLWWCTTNLDLGSWGM
ncbi:hypothetical protein CLOM_g24300 [Closterium sp. NIES-68]|nr:hypothetical protein CLOM_g24300 [Closterium sp. NIES-68]